MPPSKNNIVLIDCWDHLNHSLELAAKQNILSLLQAVEHNPDWNIYTWNGNELMDQKILAQLKSGNFNLNLDFTDPLTLFNVHHLNSKIAYFFCGFHANHCVFYNTVGIEKYFQIADTDKSTFWVIEDATVALDFDNGPCSVKDLP
jgi:hypothetical protein